MEAEAPVNQPAVSQPVVSQPVVSQPVVNQPTPKKNGPNQKRNRKKNPQHSADIVYSKGASIQTMPSLGKLLKGVTECVIGLQYVWEYRSPSKSVQPHYQCKLCAVARLQHDMLAHVKGWKHSFRYLKKVHPDKVTQEEEDAVKDPSVRKAIKEAAAEVEKTEGRGQLKVILKEPCEVLAFNGLRSAIPKPIPPGAAPGMGLKGPPFGLSGPRFSDMRYQGEYSSQGGHLSDYPVGDYGDPGYGGFDYSSRQDSYGSDMDRRPYPAGGGDDYGSGGGRTGLHDDDSGHMHPDEYQGGQMGSSLMDKPPGLMGAAPESSNLSNTLLTYLDTFRIENESDAQLVLKVTQKLTDVLMEYRLRSVSAGGPSLSSFSMGSTGFSTSSSRSFSGTSDRFSSGQSGPSRYSDGPSRYYK